jgi:ATP-dependent DNA ligase
MGDVQWLKPVVVAQVEFLEWTADNHLRDSRFVGLREDKRAGECSVRVASRWEHRRHITQGKPPESSGPQRVTSLQTPIGAAA